MIINSPFGTIFTRFGLNYTFVRKDHGPTPFTSMGELQISDGYALMVPPNGDLYRAERLLYRQYDFGNIVVADSGPKTPYGFQLYWDLKATGIHRRIWRNTAYKLETSPSGDIRLCIHGPLIYKLSEILPFAYINLDSERYICIAKFGNLDSVNSELRLGIDSLL